MAKYVRISVHMRQRKAVIKQIVAMRNSELKEVRFELTDFFFLSTSLCICKHSGDLANTCGPGEHHKAASGLLTELQCDIWISVWLESWTTII